MENSEEKVFRFGLLGKDISYSFSRGYFSKKFINLNLANHSYVNFDLETIKEFEHLLKNTKNLVGVNVTIPYKEQVIPYLDELQTSAKEIGAVNTIKVCKEGIKGYNTDTYGFQKSIEPYLKSFHKKALILGTGGASKAIAYSLEKLGIDYRFVSRSGKNNGYTYEKLDGNIIQNHQLIINSSPVGTFPNINEKPNIPYTYISKSHLLFDVIYNPEETAFLKLGKQQGAAILNGLRMLELQAEKSWEIWNS